MNIIKNIDLKNGSVIEFGIFKTKQGYLGYYQVPVGNRWSTKLCKEYDTTEKKALARAQQEGKEDLTRSNQKIYLDSVQAHGKKAR